MDGSVKEFLDHLANVNPEKYKRLAKQAKDMDDVMDVFGILAIEEMARDANSVNEFMSKLQKHITVAMCDEE